MAACAVGIEVDWLGEAMFSSQMAAVAIGGDVKVVEFCATTSTQYAGDSGSLDFSALIGIFSAGIGMTGGSKGSSAGGADGGGGSGCGGCGAG